MKMYRNEVVVGNSKKIIVTINHEVSAEKAVSRLHHIHILDRSQSMSKEIDRLIDNVQRTLDVIHDEDLLSIIWFSSAGQYRTLVKGAKKTDGLKPLLDTLRSTVGLTCFSDPVREAASIVDELHALCPNISVTLFTDGDPVVSWPILEEETRVVAEIERMRSKILAFNTVGYSPYYNQEFLKKLSAMTEFGEMFHSTKIDDYLSIFERNVEKVSGIITDPISITSASAKILYLSRNFIKTAESQLTMTRLNSSKNQFAVVMETDGVISINGLSFDSISLTEKAKPETITNILYALAADAYYTGERRESLEILARSIGDKTLVDSHLAAFTYDECARHQERLHRAIFKPKTRFADGRCSADYLSADDAFCVMDLLRILGASSSLYLPYGEQTPAYQRTLRETTDEFNLFVRTTEEVRAPFSDLVYSSEYLNLSIRFIVPGHVRLNPKAAKKVGLPENFPSYIYRTHTLINDGNVNVQVIEALLDHDTAVELLPLHGITILGVQAVGSESYTHVLIDLTAFPIINRRYQIDSADPKKLLADVVSITALEASQAVTKHYLKSAQAETAAAFNSSVLAQYSAEQLQVLQEHGLDRALAYAGIKNTTAKAEDADFYYARTLELVLKGVSSLPKVSDVLSVAATKSKVTPGQQFTLDANAQLVAEAAQASIDLRAIEPSTSAWLTEKLKSIRAALVARRSVLNTVKLAKALTGDWFVGFRLNDKGEYVFEADGTVLKIKADRKKKYF